MYRMVGPIDLSCPEYLAIVHGYTVLRTIIVTQNGIQERHCSRLTGTLY